MNGEPRPAALLSARGELAARYEQLRRHMLGGAGRGTGLILFLRQGMRAWMEACDRSAPAAWAAIGTGSDDVLLPPLARLEVTLILAGMALRNRFATQGAL